MRLESRVSWEVLGIWKAKTRDEHMLVLKCKAGLGGLRCAKSSQAGDQRDRQAACSHRHLGGKPDAGKFSTPPLATNAHKAHRRASHPCISQLPLVPTCSRTL